jgi:hypothetical protein
MQPEYWPALPPPKRKKGALEALLFALPVSLAAKQLLLLAGLLRCFLRCLLGCFFGCHVNYSPLVRCDIDNCRNVPQLHEGIVLQKINVKKKMIIRAHFLKCPRTRNLPPSWRVLRFGVER